MTIVSKDRIVWFQVVSATRACIIGRLRNIKTLNHHTPKRNNGQKAPSLKLQQHQITTTLNVYRRFIHPQIYRMPC